MGRLDDKVAIVTGGGNGMGAATCILFAKEGCKVAIADRLEDAGRSVEKRIAEAGGDAFFRPHGRGQRGRLEARRG